MITKRYVRLIEAKEKITEKINEAKERGDQGDQAEVDRLEESELRMILSDIEEENFNMSGTYDLE